MQKLHQSRRCCTPSTGGETELAWCSVAFSAPQIAGLTPTMSTRTEHDTFGPIEVPAERLWGAQTQRSLEHFAISTERFSDDFIRALAQVKRAAANVNRELGLLGSDQAGAIV